MTAFTPPARRAGRRIRKAVNLSKVGRHEAGMERVFRPLPAPG